MALTAEPTVTFSQTSIEEQVAEAVRDRALPISQLLRLMWALDADQNAVNQNLRAQLRARIGAPPLSA
ncbi:hypothetical protein MMB17_17070 [Methylobacterium organophilum]|uniref:hypothetical protein n=1 Tax=Methylobacterium organophilum TaxID=410 RepID=UPI001F13FB57|nr:hypothetical protein [Methylobacterium organophilum]UMY16405.1 hypothetical protein MMB17_17070 [Methylobacterium organophilum]